MNFILQVGINYAHCRAQEPILARLIGRQGEDSGNTPFLRCKRFYAFTQPDLSAKVGIVFPPLKNQKPALKTLVKAFERAPGNEVMRSTQISET